MPLVNKICSHANRDDESLPGRSSCGTLQPFSCFPAWLTDAQITIHPTSDRINGKATMAFLNLWSSQSMTGGIPRQVRHLMPALPTVLEDDNRLFVIQM